MNKNKIILKRGLLFIFLLVFLTTVPQIIFALSPRCINYLPFDPYDPRTWNSMGICTSSKSGLFSCALVEDHCRPGYSPFVSYDFILGCHCICERDPCCGDGVIDRQLGEECDNGTTYKLNPNIPPYLFEVPKRVWVNMSLNDYSLECSFDCKINPFCGNGIVEVGEECDEGSNNFGSISPWNIDSSRRCLSNCKLNKCYLEESVTQWRTINNPVKVKNVSCVNAWGSKYKWGYNFSDNKVQGEGICGYNIMCYNTSGYYSFTTNGSPNMGDLSLISFGVDFCNDRNLLFSNLVPDYLTTVFIDHRCSDGIDNDGDGKIDLNDPGCSNLYDDVESKHSYYLGDNIVGVPGWNNYNCEGFQEECDGIDLNGKTCADLIPGTVGILTCSANGVFNVSKCTTCGNGYCDSNENALTCFKDCGNIYGWYSSDEGWYVNEERRLVGNASSSEINIYSDPFNVKTNKEYVLSVEIINSQQCNNVYIDLNNGECLSAYDWTQKNCFNNVKLTSSGSISIVFPENVHASEGIIRGVRLRIHVPSNCLVKFDNIYFNEASDVYLYNQPNIISSVGCCPANYCWDGIECVVADIWNASNKSNLWSGIDVNGLLNKHVNTSLQWLAKGYRCTINDSGYADWKKVDIKYAWDFNESGYCIRESDCFVSHSFINTNNGGSSCIKNDEVISDNYLVGLGNHYCLNGTWTSKEFLIANILENITDNKPYILFCGKNEVIFNKQFNNIAGGCVLVLKESNEERIITGFYMINESDTKDIGSLWVDHCNNMGFDNSLCQENIFAFNLDSCVNLNNDFYKCEVDYDDPRFYIYYNVKSKYFILSSEEVIEIENRFFNNLLNTIKRFFRKLFGHNQNTLMLTNQTKNYYNIYLLSNNTLKIRAIEEVQYDESLMRNLAYMYINITGINTEIIKPLDIKYINSTLKGIYYEYESNANSLFLIIKYNFSTKSYSRIWPYLTAMNRDRP